MGSRLTQPSLPLLSKVSENDLFGCSANPLRGIKRFIMYLFGGVEQ